MLNFINIFRKVRNVNSSHIFVVRYRRFIHFRAYIETCLCTLIVSGILEFVTGYVLLHIQGVRLWDYNTEIWNWGNIGGYICARSVLFFGVSALFLQYAVYPLTKKFQTICRRDIFFVISVVPAALFVIDIIISRFCGILF